MLSLLRLTFGVVALRVAGRLPGDRPATRVWRVAGIAFCVIGSHALLQDVFAVSAFASGSESRLWDEYITWAPAANHSRHLAVTAIFPLLVLAGYGKLGKARIVTARPVTVLLVAMVLGGLLGAWEGPLLASIHYRSGSLLDAVELVTVLVVLLWLLVRDLADRLLWIALALYAISLAMSAIWIAAMMGLDSPGVWSPSPRHMHILRVTLGSGMLALALWRLALARRGISVEGLLGGMDRHRDPAAPLQ